MLSSCHATDVVVLRGSSPLICEMVLIFFKFLSSESPFYLQIDPDFRNLFQSGRKKEFFVIIMIISIIFIIIIIFYYH